MLDDQRPEEDNLEHKLLGPPGWRLRRKASNSTYIKEFLVKN